MTGGPASAASSRPAVAARTAALRLANAGLGLVASVAISRALQPQGRGVYAIAATVAAMAAVIGGLALPRALQFTWNRHHEASDLAGAAVVAGLAGGAVAALAVGTVAVLWPPLVPQGAGIVWVAVAGVPTLVASTHLSTILSLHGVPDRAAGAALIAGALQSALLVGGAATGALTPTGVIAVTTLSLVMLLPAHLRALPSAVAPGRGRAGRVRLALALARRGARYQPAGIAGHALLRADILVLAALGAAAHVGQYSLALAVTETILLVTGAVVQTGAAAQVAGTEDHDIYTARLTRTALAVAVVLAAGTAATAWLVIPALFGRSFAPSVTPLLVLLPGVCLLAAAPPLELAVSRRDRPATATGAATGAVAVMLALDVLLIPRAGATGAALAATIAYGVQFAVLARWFGRASALPLRALAPRFGDLWGPAVTLVRSSRRGGG